ncbi:PP2C family protein-serine/threonine phosphatase [Halobacteriovorax sp. YZS-1-1]|uniref:PP2C family protein-serine/threonine phosphatase n=1 Tax=unclassified Halobacteriovorax TaxID=2639665 RepID=UPI00399BEEEE
MPFKKIICDINEFESDLFDFGDYRIGYFISRHKYKEGTEQNEDSLFISGDEKSFVFGVADGAGGHPRGRDASVAISEEISKYSANSNSLDLIEAANQKVNDLKAGARATLAFAEIKYDNIRFYHVGDSEILYWNAHGNELYTSTPHSGVGHMVKAGVLGQEESLSHPERNYVNNLMGDDLIKIESTSSSIMKKGHTVLIGSDGLFDNIPHDTLTELIGQGGFDKSFEDLVNFCKTQTEDKWLKFDDTSFVVIRKVKA